jgi:hypothetical protein
MVQLALKYMAIKTVVRSGAGRSGWSGQALRLRVRRPDVRAEVGDGGTRLTPGPGKRGRGAGRTRYEQSGDFSEAIPACRVYRERVVGIYEERWSGSRKKLPSNLIGS